MIHRRSFLRSPLAANLGRPIPGLRAGASHNDWAYLGRKAWRYLGVPQDQASLRRGLHPIAPERVVVLTEQRWSGDQHPLTQDLRERFQGQLSTDKIAWIARLSKVLAAHYHVPVEPWAIGLAKREALGSCPLGLGLGRGLGAGVALLHQFQFQDDREVTPVNPPVDWWLFLFPEGIDWMEMDTQPIFGMMAHVFAEPGWGLPVYCLTTEGAGTVMMKGQEVDQMAWKRLARLDRISAARRVNDAVVRCLGRWRAEGRV